MANAIIGDKGGDDFVKESNALHCGVRKVMHPYYKEGATHPSGVEICSSLNEIDVGRMLRYKNPNVTSDYWSITVNEKESIYNPARRLLYNLLDMMVEYGDEDHLDYEYFEDGLNEICNVGGEEDENTSNEEGNSDDNGSSGSDSDNDSASDSQNDDDNGGGGSNIDNRNDIDLQRRHF